ncbi:gliding motility lipoprotein GldB [Flavobacterium cyanobacteriorum]|uniref:Gliding motility lipoprotein GldB n=1 Tax=Flavobacterium cyanobacteriorum TaxID=2022802 RepID=A0A255YXV1_9FLAO|nr:gliding motility lipoprotein GldB [Flavobacterium cyanobacteriorum]OYQ33250.1 gliding motility lipoprotein GldB [Flavobacterium cyanobacteriorum]
MKNTLFFLAVIMLMISCKKEDGVKQKVAAVPVKEVKIQRFDKLFFESGPEALPGLKQRFPYFFPAGNSDQVWIARMNEPFLKELYTEVQKKYPDVKGVEASLQDLFQHIKFYYPEAKQPGVVTLVSDDNEIKSIYTDSLVIIPLSLYLGKDNRLYEGLPKYVAQNFEPSQILPDVAASFAEGKIRFPRDRTLLAQMIYYGKQLYMKDLLLPDVPDADKIGYTKEQAAWCVANETDMWRYFIDEKLLYETDPKLASRFINPAPFSKFYREIDNESPGRVGQWIGWQIVRSYAENNPKATLQKILALDEKQLFDNSKYKPKK